MQIKVLEIRNINKDQHCYLNIKFNINRIKNKNDKIDINI